ncbi:MAG: SRPBCC domain-containing protein [Acidimicrobiia bacterium]
MIEPLRLSEEIECSAEHAFDVWTRRISTWWPKGHSASGDPGTVVTLEAKLGGRIFERTSDGTEIDWGEITDWSPPQRLAYRWYIGRHPGEATDVELTFVALGERRTRLEIVHTGWERIGTGAESWRDANSGGWAALLPSFLAAATD